MLRISFHDPDKMIRIPDLLVEDVTGTAIANHVRAYVARREPKWHVELDLFQESGQIILRKRVITIKVERA